MVLKMKTCSSDIAFAARFDQEFCSDNTIAEETVLRIFTYDIRIGRHAVGSLAVNEMHDIRRCNDRIPGDKRDRIIYPNIIFDVDIATGNGVVAVMTVPIVKRISFARLDTPENR